ncbi:hypothetical protein ABZ468_51445 [Streptomyces sp. NPDC005708]|uniref:hypothetical protein n=1 Tax=Streptomyces sp. NPDC005708 TaxID=3154564 RepID=UPI0033C82D83
MPRTLLKRPSARRVRREKGGVILHDEPFPLTAMLGWAAGKADWKDGFMWNNIGSQFGADDAHARYEPEPPHPKG